MADSKSSHVDPYGFERSEDFDYQSYEDFFAGYLSVLARRAKKWSGVVGDKESMKKGSTLKRYCRKGIPAEHRPMIWLTLSGAHFQMKRNAGLYQQILRDRLNPSLVETIKTDIPRTYPDNIYFKDLPNDPKAKRTALFNVLAALGTKNENVGYCQGLNFIAGLLLLVVKDEEKVFWLMNTLINDILPDYYSPNMVGIKADQEVLSELVKSKFPDVFKHLDNHSVAVGLVTTKWFICCFADVLPIETVLRIWDSLFYEGNKVIFRVCLTLIKMNRDKLLAAKNFPEITEVFKHMTTDASTMNCHDFMQSIFEEPGSLPLSKITKLRHKNVEKVLAEG